MQDGTATDNLLAHLTKNFQEKDATSSSGVLGGIRQILFYLESLWCRDFLLSSQLCLPFCKHQEEIAPLLRGHLLSMLSSITEVLALVLLLLGAFLNNTFLVVLGAFSKMLSQLFGGWSHNKSAAFLSVWSMQFFDKIVSCQRELQGFLHNQGLTDAEIAALPASPQELYQTELHNVPNALLLQFLTPLVSMGIFWFFGEWVLSLSIGLLGCAAFPLSQWFYKQFHFGQHRLFRLAHSAHAYDAIKSYYGRHVSLTMRVNIMGQIPLFLFAASMSLGVIHSPFAHYLALTLGLSSLSGLLALQRTRLHAQQTIQRMRHVFDLLAKTPFLISQDAIQRHIAIKDYSGDIPKRSGIFVDQLYPIGIKRLIPFSPITFFIPSGGASILQAPSGYGKSLLILSLLHHIDHSGEVWICGEEIRSTYSLHALPPEDWSRQFAFFRQEELLASTRLIDLFAPVFPYLYENVWHRLNRHSKSLAQMVFFGSDVLLEQELSHTVTTMDLLLPTEWSKELTELRKEKINWLHTLLKTQLPNDVHPERVFCTLSSGEKQRLLNLLTITVAEHAKTKLIILDEPLAHLDEQAISQQIAFFQTSQKRLQIPFLIITHHHVQLLRQSLEEVEILSLDSVPKSMHAFAT